MKKDCIAIITARGGSKRIPRKNIKPFLGIPILKYSIDAALNASCFDEVIVSTDDKEIADMAISFGAKVPFLRSGNTSDDYATTADVLSEVLQRLADTGKTFEYCCCIYPTAPFVTAKILSTSFDSLLAHQADALVPVTEFSYPIYRAFQIQENGFLSFVWPEFAVTRSQDIPKTYHDAGQFYFLKTSKFRETGKLFQTNTVPLIIPESAVQDIDTEEDWKMAEIKYQMLIRE